MRAALKTALAILLVGVVAAAFLTFWPQTTLSQSTGPIFGYAWSDTIGWIDLNCENTGSCDFHSFGLFIGGDGTISGYAWSDNIGWVSANAADLAGCPESPCSATLSGNSFSGWVRALSGGSSQSGGWDGFISLDGPDYGITLTGDTFQGYAWGSTVVGWVDFSLATLEASQCEPGFFCTDDELYYRTSVCQDQFVQACVFGCTGSFPNAHCIFTGAQFVPFAAFLNGASFQATGELQARPALVRQGEAAQLYWNTANVGACSVIGTNGFSSTSTFSGASGENSGAIIEQTTFTLDCTGLGGEPLSDDAVVNVLPIFQEQ